MQNPPRSAPDKLLIDGAWVPASGSSFPLVNPATGKVNGTCPVASSHDVALAVAAARRAFDTGPWGATSGVERATHLECLADAIAARREALAMLDVLNVGKPLAEALDDITDVVKCLHYYAAAARRLDDCQSEVVELPDGNFTCRIDFEPVGVVGAITPWNYPLLMVAWKIAPALAAGCTVVLKPSELSPWSALELGALALQVGLPAGVLNVVTGGAEVGKVLSERDDIDRLAFTGSVATGRAVMQAGARNIKPVGLELGGKSPIVVCEDADLGKALAAIQLGIFFNQGEVCSATSRLIVHAARADELLEQLVKAAGAIRVGDGLHPQCQMGPLVSSKQYEKVLAYIASAQQEGATLLCGGKRPANLFGESDLTGGYFVAPTVFKDVTPAMRVWREEIFGPVLVVCTFEDDAHAIHLANDSEYGLAAAVISEDAVRRRQFVRAFKAGIVWENTSQPTFVQAPWSGWKKSGIGVELGTLGLAEYRRAKQVTALSG